MQQVKLGQELSDSCSGELDVLRSHTLAKHTRRQRQAADTKKGKTPER